MLMKTNETSYFTFAVAVAVNCSAVVLSADATPEQAAAYLEDVLSGSLMIINPASCSSVCLNV